MKRSEMIDLMVNSAKDHMYREDAEAALDAMLAAGMLPPVMEGVYDNVPTVTPTGNHDYGWKRGWEPEDVEPVIVYLIVNDTIKKVELQERQITVRNNLEYLNDDYGMGSVDWPIIRDPRDAYKRQLQENLLWAKSRMKWAVDNAPEEVPELSKIIENEGHYRLENHLEKFVNQTMADE